MLGIYITTYCAFLNTVYIVHIKNSEFLLMVSTFWIFKCHHNHGGLKGVKFCTFLTSFVLQPLNHCVTWSLSQFISKEKCAFRLVGKPTVWQLHMSRVHHLVDHRPPDQNQISIRRAFFHAALALLGNMVSRRPHVRKNSKCFLGMWDI